MTPPTTETTLAPAGPLAIPGTNLHQLSVLLGHTERLATLGTLTASMAHELNNPVSIIISACNDVKGKLDEGSLDEEHAHRLLGVIEESAWRCARLVQTLSRYSHPAGPAFVPADLNEIINDTLTLLQYEFRTPVAVALVTALAPDLPPVLWDQNQISQVLVNLLTNARDALTPAGGEITIRSWAIPMEERVAFSVSDDGPGVPPAILGRIFEPFFTTKPAGQGTGLGLSIAAGIVAQHQGRISVANNPAGGVTFTVVLPTRPGER